LYKYTSSRKENDLPSESEKLLFFSDFFKALAHPTRIHLVEDLAEGEKCVCDLAAKIDADISTVSRHLRELRNVGIVACEKRGNQVFYRLRAPCILNFLQCLCRLGQQPASGRRQGV
jgi:ArsR family transcriptional regulator